MLVNHVRQHVAECERILGVDTRSVVTLGRAVNDSLPQGESVLYFSPWNGPVNLRICGDIVEGPSSEVEAGLVNRGGRPVEHPSEESRRSEAIGVVVIHRPPL